jgi:hypothetical protein
MTTSKPLQTKHWLALLSTLFVIVLIAHLAIITSARGQFSTQKSEQINTFTTRMIELTAPIPVIEKMPEVVAPPKPVKSKTKASAAPKEVPNPAPVTQVAPALVPIPVESVAVAPTPIELPPPTTELAALTPEPAPEKLVAATSDTGLPPPAFTVLNSGQHTYKVIFTKNGVVNQGKAQAEWRQDGEKYTLGLTASLYLVNVFTWGSKGLISAAGLLPNRFSDTRFNKPEVATHFERAAEEIIFSANTPKAILETGAQDRVSIIWQLAGLLAAEPARYPPGTTLSMQTADDREAQTWVFTVNEPETLNLETGSQIALRITRNPRREFDRKIELWFAPAMGYLPVRFRQTQTNGDYEDLVWQSTQTLPSTIN